VWETTLRIAGVSGQKLSNGKRKGSANTKNGNKYLAWAFVEAANFAVRYQPRIRSFYQRKKSKTNGIVAIKAVVQASNGGGVPSF
jgi:transposase